MNWGFHYQSPVWPIRKGGRTLENEGHLSYVHFKQFWPDLVVEKPST